MLTIALGLIIGGIFIWFSDNKVKSQKGKKWLFTLAVVEIWSALIIGTICPISGYNEWEKVKEIEVDTETMQEYIEENIEEIEASNCKTSYLYVYEKSGKQTIWTFAANPPKTKYVVYVPENTIS